MASVVCSPRHHHRSYICRRLSSAPPGHARPRSGPSGLNTTRFLRSHPMSTGRGCPASCASMEASDSNQGPEHLIVLVHGIMASPSNWTYGEAVLKKRLGNVTGYIFRGFLNLLPDMENTEEYHQMMEEEMIRGLEESRRQLP
ncbi:uncharacterized protein LOC119336383 [Triticum dicoccoides]|uniref:uncharacterized protein LOC119336383 n=1 Tax=Triticum dicoccoides TaxID=85692 RepID=UPI001891C3B3|nr:uncharacterized protein LOC119336383 [Triticum dicoccoides]